MTRKDQLMEYIDALLPDEILVTMEYHLKDGYKIDERRSVHEFNCDPAVTRELIESNFNTELLGNYTYDKDNKPIDGVVVLIDTWTKGSRLYYPEEGGNE